MKKSIVISGPPAVGKTTVARGLAGEFGMRYLSGGDVLKEMARDEGYDSAGDDWWDTKEGLEFLSKREQNPEFDRKLDDRLAGIFSGGGVVITSYTLPWLVDGGIKIWLGGSHVSSMKRMQARDNMGPEEAYDVARQRFDKNRTLYKKMYGFDFGEDVSVFDAVIDTDDLTARQVIGVATETVRRLL